MGQGRCRGQAQAKPDAGCIVAKRCHAVRVFPCHEAAQVKNSAWLGDKKRPVNRRAFKNVEKRKLLFVFGFASILGGGVGFGSLGRFLGESLFHGC